MSDLSETSPDSTTRAVRAAASRLLVAEGPDRLTLRGVAREAGVSTMAVYSRFGGKEGLIDALRAEGFAAVVEAQAGIAYSADPLADLRAMLLAWREVALANRAHYVLMFPVTAAPAPLETGPHSAPLAAAAFTHLVERVARAVEAGVLWGEPRGLALGLFAACHGLVCVELGGLAPPGVGAASGVAYRMTIDRLLAGCGPMPGRG